MSILDQGARSLDLLGLALRGLDAIGHLAKLGSAEEALVAIARVVESIREGFHYPIDLKTIEDEIVQLRTALANNDTAVETELDKKFPR